MFKLKCAKSFWLVEGDSNSKFFHAYATARNEKKKSNIGANVTDQASMCEVVQEYFTGVFIHDEEWREESLVDRETMITDEQNLRLVEEFTFEEFSIAIKQMHLDKCAGPDGLNPTFYQNFWSLLGKEVFLTCKYWLQTVFFPESLNDTTIVLILKKDNAVSMKDIRHIALCNVLYKTIAKILSNCL